MGLNIKGTSAPQKRKLGTLGCSVGKETDAGVSKQNNEWEEGQRIICDVTELARVVTQFLNWTFTFPVLRSSDCVGISVTPQKLQKGSAWVKGKFHPFLGE